MGLLLPPTQAFLGDNERGRIGEHGNGLEARAGGDGKEKIVNYLFKIFLLSNKRATGDEAGIALGLVCLF